eukprot:g7409.t1
MSLVRQRKTVIPADVVQDDTSNNTENINLCSMSIDDMEGLATTLGVMAALMLSFAVGVFATITIEEYYIGDYRWALFTSKDFTKVAAQVFEHEGVNMTMFIPPNEYFDIKAFMNKPMDFHKGNQNFNKQARQCIFDGPWDKCSDDFKKMVEVVSLTSDIFPQKYYYVWAARNPHTISMSERVGDSAGWTTSMLTCSLVSSILVYACLSLSSLREMKEKADIRYNQSLKRFNCIVIPWLLLDYIILTGGIIYFFDGLLIVTRLRHPIWEFVQRYKVTYQWHVRHVRTLTLGSPGSR